ncbi:MAG: hypothetical protein K2M95_07980, partial [Clostridiales bacterium]|nr:hypothetical protein [Clostridiales bacterium]
LVIVLADRTLCGGAFGYLALVSGLLGISLFLVVKFVVKEEGAPAYLPTPDDDDADEENAKTDERPASEQAKPDEEKDEQKGE